MRSALRALGLLACIGLAWASFAHAQMLAGIAAPTAGVSFVGVIDKDPNITLYGGIVAGSTAIANAHATAVDLCKATGCAGTDLCASVPFASTGYINTSYVCPSTSTSVSSFYSAASGSCATSGSVRVSKVYEQVGGGATSWTAASYAVSPTFCISGGPGALPAMLCARTRTTALDMTVAITHPETMGATFERTSNFTSSMGWIEAPAADVLVGSGTSANTAKLDVAGGISITGITATDGTGLSDTAHYHNLVFTISALSSPTVKYAIDGNTVVSSSQSFGATIATLKMCGNGGTAAGFLPRVWLSHTTPTDPVMVNSTDPALVGF